MSEFSAEIENFIDSPLLSFVPAQIKHFSRDNLGIGEVSVFDPLAVLKAFEDRRFAEVYAIDCGGNKLSGNLWCVMNGKLIAQKGGVYKESTQGRGYLELLESVAASTQEDINVGLSVAGPLEGTHLKHAPNMKILEQK